MENVHEKFKSNVDRLFVKPEDVQGRIIHSVMGCAGEVGELVDTIKKHWIYGQPLDISNIKEEIGDTLFYLQALATECGLTLEKCMEGNIEKLSQRYPSGYTDKAAKERADKI